MTGVGLAAVVAYLWFPYVALLLAGAVMAVLAGASLIGVLRRGRQWHKQDVLIRKLWAAVKRIPSGYVLADPETAELLSWSGSLAGLPSRSQRLLCRGSRRW